MEQKNWIFLSPNFTAIALTDEELNFKSIKYSIKAKKFQYYQQNVIFVRNISSFAPQQMLDVYSIQILNGNNWMYH